MRTTYTHTSSMGGCWTCQPDGTAMWDGKNAVGVAARHHDATGHRTWCEQHLMINYGDRP